MKITADRRARTHESVIEAEVVLVAIGIEANLDVLMPTRAQGLKFELVKALL